MIKKKEEKIADAKNAKLFAKVAKTVNAKSAKTQIRQLADAKLSAKAAKEETASAKDANAKGAEEYAKGAKKETANAKSAKESAEGVKETAKKEETKEAPKTHKPQKPHIKKRGKKYKEVSKLIDKEHNYLPEEAVELAIKTATTNFDPSIEVHIRLGIKPEQTEQNIRTVVDLPEGTGKEIKIAAIVNPQKEKETKEAGADFVGSDDLISKIEKGFLGFDVVVATPDMMSKIGKLGKILGTKGLMPNPKTETVAEEPQKVVKLLKKGRIELKNDSYGIVHTIFGKVSQGKEKLINNFKALLEGLFKAKPQAVKGQFVKSISVSTTMGPSIKVDQNKLSALIQRQK